MKPSYPKLIFAGILTLYFASIAYSPMQGSFLDMVDLPIHETGHLLFRIFGEFMGIAGGTLFQLIFPAVFVGYFIYSEKYYSAAVVLFWVGQSFINVYIYAQDAVTMQLMLTSGMTGSEGGFHDWNYMLDSFGLLGSTKPIAGLIRLVGAVTIVGAAAASIYYSLYPQQFEEFDDL